MNFKYSGIRNIIFDNVSDYNELLKHNKYFDTLNPRKYLDNMGVIVDEVYEKNNDDNPEIVKQFFKDNFLKYKYVFHCRIYNIPFAYIKDYKTGYIILSGYFDFVICRRPKGKYSSFEVTEYSNFNLGFELEYSDCFLSKYLNLKIGGRAIESYSFNDTKDNVHSIDELKNKMIAFWEKKKKVNSKDYILKYLKDKFIKMGTYYVEPMIEFRDKIESIRQEYEKNIITT